MATPNKQYKVFNISETNPTGVPDSGFVWLFPRDAAIWVRLPDGQEYQLLKLSQTGSASIPVWTTATNNIKIGDYFLYDDFLYRASKPSGSADPKQPDLFPTFWESVDLSDLTHAQNTDFKLGVYKSNILDPYVNEFLLYTSTYNTKNYLQIGDDQLQWDTDEDITLKTFDSVSGNFADQEFFVKVVNNGQSGRAVFTTNAFQDVGDGLILSDGDWAVFKGNVDGVTQLIASSIAGDFIPLSGTFEGNPVTGIVKFQSSGGGVIEINIAEFEGAIELKSNDGVGVANIGSSALNYSGEYLSGESQLPFSNTFLFSQQIGFLLTSDSENSLGLSADRYFGVNYTDNTYVQKKYVDDIANNTIAEVSTDVTPDIDETGTLSTVSAGSTSATIAGGPYTADELAGKYLIVTHDDLTGISRTPITAHLISANTTDGILTFSPAIQYAGTPSYQVVTPYAATIDEQDNLIAANASDNIVITVPAITATDNRASLTIYREGGNDPDSEHTVFIAMQNNVLGTPNVTLINDYELIELRAHTSGTFHWDFLGSNRLCVSLNVSITTPDVTPLSNTTDETIKGTVWELNHPSRWSVEVLGDGSVEATYNSRIKRNLEISAIIDAVRDGGSPELTLTAQIYTEGAWETIDSTPITLTNTANKDGRTFVISHCFVFGEKFRVLSRTNNASNTYHISNLRIKMAYPNG
jgi:hypothetical protein